MFSRIRSMEGSIVREYRERFFDLLSNPAEKVRAPDGPLRALHKSPDDGPPVTDRNGALAPDYHMVVRTASRRDIDSGEKNAEW